MQKSHTSRGNEAHPRTTCPASCGHANIVHGLQPPVYEAGFCYIQFTRSITIKGGFRGERVLPGLEISA